MLTCLLRLFDPDGYDADQEILFGVSLVDEAV